MTAVSTRPMVSVVIPHYGGKDILSECLISLKNCTYPNLEIIVMDNDSPDDSIQYIKTNFPEINLIQSEYNRGFSGGCNFGVQHAQGEYLLILNNDTIHESLADEWLPSTELDGGFLGYVTGSIPREPVDPPFGYYFDERNALQ